MSNSTTATATQLVGENTGDDSGTATSTNKVLKLKLKPKPKVTWSNDTVDNENQGKKTSKSKPPFLSELINFYHF